MVSLNIPEPQKKTDGIKNNEVAITNDLSGYIIVNVLNKLHCAQKAKKAKIREEFKYVENVNIFVSDAIF
jgi:hypothetical protein